MHLSSNIQKQSSQCGIALVFVLWMLVLLTVMAGSYSATMRTETISTARQVQAARARALAEAGLWLAIKDLRKPKARRLWQTNGSPATVMYAGNTIRVRIQDEAGKIDLNTAREEILQGLLKTTGISEERADSITDAIQHWRGRRNRARRSGAEDPDYRAANPEYHAKGGPFNSVGELRLVLGMTEAIFQKIQAALTVHSHLPSINAEVAVRGALLALPGSEAIAVDDFILDREEEPNTTLAGVAKGMLSKTQGKTFQITSEGLSGHSKVRLDVIILLKRKAKLPFTVLSWREGLPAGKPLEEVGS